VKFGVYTAILHDRPLAEALEVITSLVLDGAEVNSGGFLPPLHIPIDDVLAS
jgi:sugar phosphate isomerase/epimerase